MATSTHSRALPRRLAAALFAHLRVACRRTASPDLTLFLALGALVGFLFLASRADLFPVWSIGPLVRGELSLPDAISLSFQLFVYAVTLVGFVWYYRLSHGIAKEKTHATAAIECLRSVDPKSSRPQVVFGADMGEIGVGPSITKRFVDRLHATGVPSEPNHQSALVSDFGDELREPVQRLTALQKPCLRFGILGTFLGLALAMLQLKNLGGGNFLASSSSLFTALQSCFTTSIAGLVGSVVIATLAGALGSRIVDVNRFWRDILWMADAAGTAAGFVPDNANGLQSALRSVAQCMVEQTVCIEDQTRAIRNGMHALELERGKLDTFLDGVGQIRQSVLNELRLIRDHIEPKVWAKQIEREFGEVLEVVTSRMEKEVKGTFASLTQSGEALASSRHALELTTRITADQFEAQRQQQQKAAASESRSLELLGELRELLREFAHASRVILATNRIEGDVQDAHRNGHSKTG